MIKKKIKLDFLPVRITFVVLENKDEDFNRLAKEMRDDYSNGKTFIDNGNNILILIDMGKWDFVIDMIPHEVEHAVDMAEKYIGQDYQILDEYRAYLIGYINQQITSTMLDSGYSMVKYKGRYIWTKINSADNQTDSELDIK